MTGRLSDDHLDQAFAALANRTRRAILARLEGGEATVTELAEPFNLTLPAISKHIKVLERAGLATRGQLAQYRPCALDVDALAQVAAWADQCRPTWEARFNWLADYLMQLKTSTSKGGTT